MLPPVSPAPRASAPFRILRSLGIAAFVTLVVLWAAVGPGRLLCVGADGHVHVEMSQRGCCDAGPDTRRDAAADECEACIDIEMPDSPATAASAELPAARAAIASAPAPVAFVPAPLRVPDVRSSRLARHASDPPPDPRPSSRMLPLRC